MKLEMNYGQKSSLILVFLRYYWQIGRGNGKTEKSQLQAKIKNNSFKKYKQRTRLKNKLSSSLLLSIERELPVTMNADEIMSTVNTYLLRKNVEN